MNMKKFLLVAAVLPVSLSLAFGAESKGSKSSGSKSPGSKVTTMGGKLGLGLILGEPTGASAKYYFTRTVAADAAAGWSLSDEVFRIHGDVLFHNHSLLSKAFDGFPLVLYYGVGAKFVFADDFTSGVRIPVGALHNFKKPPIDLFLEVVPVVRITPDVGLDFDAGLGARYFFKL